LQKLKSCTGEVDIMDSHLHFIYNNHFLK